MSGKTARRNRKNANRSGSTLGFPPVNDTTLVFTVGCVNRPKRVLIRFGNTALSIDDGVEFTGYRTSVPSLAENFGFTVEDCVEVLLWETSEELPPDVYFVGNGRIQTFQGERLLTVSEHLPSPTSVVVSAGFNSFVLGKAGLITEYEHPRETVLYLVCGRKDDDLDPYEDEVRLCPQESTRFWFGDTICEPLGGFDIWTR